MLLEKIEELLKEVDALTAQNAEEVEQLRIKYLSKKGEINSSIFCQYITGYNANALVEQSASSHDNSQMPR